MIVSIDLDHDQDIDLIVARNDGVYVYENEDSKFAHRRESLCEVALTSRQVIFSLPG